MTLFTKEEKKAKLKHWGTDPATLWDVVEKEVAARYEAELAKRDAVIAELRDGAAHRPTRSEIDGLIYRFTGISERQFPDEYDELKKLADALVEPLPPAPTTQNEEGETE